jgi:hypothetical protein
MVRIIYIYIYNTCEMAGFECWWIMNVQAPWVLRCFSSSLLFLVETCRKVAMASAVLSYLQFNRTGVILLKLVITRLVDIKIDIKIFIAIVSPATAPECLLLYFKCTQINPQAHGYRCSFHQEYSRVSYLSSGKQWLKKLIIHHHVSTN